MKIWQIIILVVLLISLPVLSACDLFGGPSEEEEYYRQQLEAYRQQQEAYRKSQEEYYKKLAEGLNKYLEAYQDYQQSLTEAQIQAAGGDVVIVTANQTPPQENGEP